MVSFCSGLKSYKSLKLSKSWDTKLAKVCGHHSPKCYVLSRHLYKMALFPVALLLLHRNQATQACSSMIVPLCTRGYKMYKNYLKAFLNSNLKIVPNCAVGTACIQIKGKKHNLNTLSRTTLEHVMQYTCPRLMVTAAALHSYV